MIMNFKAAVVQVTSTARVSNNLTKCRQFVEEAARAGAKVIGLPENFSFMGSESEKQSLLGQIEDETILFLKETASELGIYLLGGGFPTKAPSGKVFNTAVMINPKGEEVFRYHKVHLFDAVVGDGFPYKESNHTESGEKVPEVIQTEYGKISSAICYDLRFPELFRALSKQGVDLCFLPAAFTVPTGEAHWHVLLRARAIENLMYVLAPGQTGTHDPHGKRKTFGHSLIISPWGEILAELDHEEGFAIATMEMEKLSEIRNTLPSLNHRKF